MAIRRYGPPPPRIARARLRPGVYAALRLGGGILLTVQADGDAAPELQLPGGGVDPGEQPLVALHREVAEETGWRIAAPRRVGAFRVFGAVPSDAFAPVAPRSVGPGAVLGRERVWARTRAVPGSPAGRAEIMAEKVCVVYAARAVRSLGPPSEPGHAAVVLTPGDALAALGAGGAASMLRRAIAGGWI